MSASRSLELLEMWFGVTCSENFVDSLGEDRWLSCLPQLDRLKCLRLETIAIFDTPQKILDRRPEDIVPCSLATSSLMRHRAIFWEWR